MTDNVHLNRNKTPAGPSQSCDAHDRYVLHQYYRDRGRSTLISVLCMVAGHLAVTCGKCFTVMRALWLPYAQDRTFHDR